MGGRSRQISEFKTNLLYRVSTKTAGLQRETLTGKKRKEKERENYRGEHSQPAIELITGSPMGELEKGLKKMKGFAVP